MKQLTIDELNLDTLLSGCTKQQERAAITLNGQPLTPTLADMVGQETRQERVPLFLQRERQQQERHVNHLHWLYRDLQPVLEQATTVDKAADAIGVIRLRMEREGLKAKFEEHLAKALRHNSVRFALVDAVRQTLPRPERKRR